MGDVLNRHMGDQRRLRNTPRYKNMRREFMQDAPLCAKCQRDGFTVGARELDHIVPVHLAPEAVLGSVEFARVVSGVSRG